MLRSLVFAAGIVWASSAYALEPNEILGTWQDDIMRVEINADSIIMGFVPPNYDQDVDRSPITFQQHQEGLHLSAPDGSGVLVTLQPDGRLSWTFPGVATTTLERVTSAD